MKGCLLAAGATCGFTSLFAGWVPSLIRPAGSMDISKRILQHHDSDVWSARYIENGYAFRDPIVSHLQTCRMPFAWGDAYDACPRADDVALIKGEASEFGLRHGYVVPIVLQGGLSLAFSFGGYDADIDPDNLAQLSFITNFAVGRLLNLMAPASFDDGPALTAREKDCLSWASEGKTDWERSVILGIARSTVLKHIASAREKLGATNKFHAVSIALRSKILK